MSKGRYFSIFSKPLLALHLIYVVFHSLPGSPLAFESSLKENYQNYLIEKFKLDQGIWEQYTSFFTNLFTWSWGYSISEYPRQVGEVFANALVPTLKLGFLSIAIVILTSLGTVFFANFFKQGRFVFKIEKLLSFFQGVPTLFLGPFLIYVFAIQLDWLPVALLESGWSCVLPVFCLSFRPFLMSSRLLLLEMVRLSSSDVARTARSKGLPRWQILATHLLKLASPVYIASLFNTSVAIIGGSVLVEVLFGINGIGSLFLRSLEQRDAPVAMAIASFYCGCYFILNLIYEASLRLIDPRVLDHERILR